MEDVIELNYVRYVGHLGDMGGVGDVRDIEVGIGTCLTVFLMRGCSQITSSYFGGFWTIYIVNHTTIIF